ncbi:hypothetical protein CO661_14030 [Sinorhizobium fredii]|uniref:Uncharacterized protein n=1 Tax=Rhizobium fredii TaxID=380 RepID=A0A2A6LYJ0_RHIFR|nr:hypothetical protein [Sinorhizobium fredii]PDT47296.1 hypothetical protein CO661_14030 [Sinorhizobium fredii]
MSTETGGPAFPRPYFENQNGSEWSASQDGMSLRDWFAGKAIPELMRDPGDRAPFCEVAKLAYEMADAMLAARKAGAL